MVVTFKTAKLAKEKGFDFPCNNGFSPLGEELDNSWKFVCNDSRSIPRPTQSELQKWLREEHNLNVDIVAYYDEKDLPLSKDNRPKPLGYFAWDYYNENFCVEDAPKFEKYEDALEYDLFNKLELIPLTVRFPMYREEIYVTKI